MKWTAQQVCSAFGVDRRTLTNWLNEEIPVPSTKADRAREFESNAVIRWFADRELRQARKAWEKERPASTDEVKEARDRRTINEARLVEIQVEEAEGRLIPLDVHEECVETVTTRLAAQCKGLDRYIADVQRSTTNAEAKAVLDRISDALLASLQRVADGLDGEADDGAVAA